MLSFGLTLLPDAYQLHQALGRAQDQRGAVADAIRGYEGALRLKNSTAVPLRILGARLFHRLNRKTVPSPSCIAAGAPAQ